jgi:hypothetical protein
MKARKKTKGSAADVDEDEVNDDREPDDEDDDDTPSIHPAKPLRPRPVLAAQPAKKPAV